MMNIKILFKKLVTESAVYALGPSLQTAVTFLLVPIYTKYLSTSHYGELEFILALVSFLTPVMDAGLTSAFWKYRLEESDKDSTRVLANVFTGKLILSSSIALILGLFSQFSTNQELNLLVLFSISLIGQSILQSIYLYLQANHKAFFYVVLSVSLAVAIGGFNLVFLAVYNLGLLGIAYGNIAGVFLVLLLFSPSFAKLLQLKLNPGLMRNMLQYGAPLILGNIVFLITSTADRFFLNQFSPSSDLGLYGYGVKFASLMNILIITPFFLGFNPIRWEIYSRPDSREVFSRLYTVLFTSLLFCYFFFTGLGVFLGSVMTANPDFIPGLKATPFRVFSWFLYGLYYFRSMGLLFEKKTMLISIVITISAAVNILLNFLLVPRFSYLGAAVASTLSYFILFMVCSFLSDKYYPIRINHAMEFVGLIVAFVPCVYILLKQDYFLPGEFIRMVLIAGSIAAFVSLIVFSRRKFFLTEQS